MRTAHLPHGSTLDVPLCAFVSCRTEFAHVLVTAGVWWATTRLPHKS